MKSVIAAAVMLAVGCGSTGAGSDGGIGGAPGDGGAGVCRADASMGASVSWAEDGVPRCAVAVVAQRSTEGTSELLGLQALTFDGSGASVGFDVITFGRALEGTHACTILSATDGGLPGAPGTVYVAFIHSSRMRDCSVTITNGGVVGGANATGTFSATFTDGIVVTNGMFDTPVRAGAATTTNR